MTQKSLEQIATELAQYAVLLRLRGLDAEALDLDTIVDSIIAQIRSVPTTPPPAPETPPLPAEEESTL